MNILNVHIKPKLLWLSSKCKNLFFVYRCSKQLRSCAESPFNIFLFSHECGQVPSLQTWCVFPLSMSLFVVICTKNILGRQIWLECQIGAKIVFVWPKSWMFSLGCLRTLLWSYTEKVSSMGKGGARSWPRSSPEALPAGLESVYSSPGNYAVVVRRLRFQQWSFTRNLGQLQTEVCVRSLHTFKVCGEITAFAVQPVARGRT